MITETSVYIERKFECAIDELFQWLVNPELVAKWFGPKQFSVTNVTNDLKIGGAFEIELTKYPDKVLVISGNYLEIEMPRKLVFTFHYGGFNNPPPDSVVTMLLEKISAESTQLFLEQKFAVAPTDLEQRDQAWRYMFSKLAQLLS
ncbi:MAG: SRPBCC domain-containing protein [Saprospiraceae bacterium]|nr:SRPBCC domain-containing protein [Saprospiraceae bacterium]